MVLRQCDLLIHPHEVDEAFKANCVTVQFGRCESSDPISDHLVPPNQWLASGQRAYPVEWVRGKACVVLELVGE